MFYIALPRDFKVIIYTTTSLDGGIDRIDKHIALSSNRDLARLHMIRSYVDAVVVGANTVLKDDPLLTVRLPSYKGRQPYRVVVDGKLRVNPSYRVFDTKIAPSVIITSNRFQRDIRVQEFVSKNVDVIFVDELDRETLDLGEGFKELVERYGVEKILVEGGGFLIASLFKQRLVDTFIVSISPLILGLNKVSLVNDFLEETIELELIGIDIDHVSGEIIAVYKPIY